ncbi:TetR/AcrR family transcriptional regulator [Couchioplanes caeruleus]|uniref:TetR/AcrR family transcriptional regulator n=1 Tax=Couchioplanes caeruleus TaxID=56438 RepID=UPI000B082116|nr:TetR/AcrR family transcriptional regulator [Couchioplanes caeruleus]
MYRNRASGAEPTPAPAGRARDPDIDARILAAARRQLSLLGYEGMSLASVAQEAGTTRQALYRRWASKADLAGAAVAAIEEDPGRLVPEDDPFGALVAELADFQRGVSRPGRLSLVGTMLQETTEPDVVDRYRAQVITPRRRRIRAIFEAAQRLGLIDQDADLSVAVTMCTGSWYGRALAGTPVPANWPQRTATLVWRALGGRPPTPDGSPDAAGLASRRSPESACADDGLPDGGFGDIGPRGTQWHQS